MAPPKKQVSPAEAIHVYHYFRDNWKRYDRFLKDPDTPRRSADALEKIRDLQWDEEECAKAMQAWMDEHVTPAGVKRMWGAMRQRKYQLEKHPVLVALEPETHFQLAHMAKRYNITLTKMVEKLIKEHEETGKKREPEVPYRRESRPPAKPELPAEPVKSTEEAAQEGKVPAPHDPDEYRAHVAGLILKLKDEKGLNYRMIADELNARKLKTFGGKSDWKQAMVSRIYKTASGYEITQKAGDKKMNANAYIMDRIRARPGAMDGALVWIPDLRKEVEEALNSPPDVFDNAVRELALKDEIILHRHAHVARITAQERREFVTDGESWFVGLALNV